MKYSVSTHSERNSLRNWIESHWRNLRFGYGVSHSVSTAPSIRMVDHHEPGLPRITKSPISLPFVIEREISQPGSPTVWASSECCILTNAICPRICNPYSPRTGSRVRSPHSHVLGNRNLRLRMRLRIYHPEHPQIPCVMSQPIWYK